jgi:hypothetical protein
MASARLVEGSCQVVRLLLVDKILAVFQAAARITRNLYEGAIQYLKICFQNSPPFPTLAKTIVFPSLGLSIFTHHEP